MTPTDSNPSGQTPVSEYVDPAYTLETFRTTLQALDERFAKIAKSAASLRRRVGSNVPTPAQLRAAQGLSAALNGDWTESEMSELWFTAEIMLGGYVVSDDGTEMVTLEEQERIRASARKTPTAPAPIDAVAQACSIAHRAAARPEIDWLREPQSDRERKVRRVILDRICDKRRSGTATGAVLELWALLPTGLSSDASDWSEAFERMDAASDLEREERRRRKLDEAIEAVDNGGVDA